MGSIILPPEKLFGVHQTVLSYALSGAELPEPARTDPTWQAALTLWKIALSHKSPASARLGAIKEYHDRVYGKVVSHEETKDSTDKVEVDLDRLSDSEQATFLALLAKVQGLDEIGGGGDEDSD